MDVNARKPGASARYKFEFLEEKKIVIVGAGVAGLTAASSFCDRDFKNVLVLEARDVIGGRVQTRHFGTDFIEMGAEWIHGHRGNSIYDVARDDGLVEEKFPDYMESTFKWSNIANEEHREAISSTFSILELAMDKLNYFGDGEITDFPKSLDDYLSSHFESYLLKCQDSDHIKVIKRACYDWYLKFQFELNGCNKLSDVSCKLLRHYLNCDGCHVTELKSGYSSVLNSLIKDIPEDWIVKNQEVKSIVWDENSSIDEKMSELQLSDHSKFSENRAITINCTNGKKYYADHVIVTIPLGCLKESHHSLFVPPLPPSKVEAIECIGFGAVNKIYLEFPEPFWEDYAVFNMLWVNESFHSLLENDSFQKDLKDSWYKYINRFAYVSHHPKMLCAWIVGDGAVFMESLPEKQVLEQCHKLLQQQLRRNDIPLPSKIIRSKWTSDPFSRGCYSYLSVSCEEAGIYNQDLESPILRKSDSCPIVLFAGEATHPFYFSTVHGAYDSGRREATRITDYHRSRLASAKA